MSQTVAAPPPPEPIDPPAPPGPAGPTIDYVPALDGLRGLAAAGVVCFHLQLDWMRGGFLGVTTFFALSGFLLTSLLVAEHRQTGTVDVVAFWGRRFRRLLPAALATLAAVAALAPLLATPEQLASLRGDVTAAVAYVANWRFIADGRAYADLFSSPSPVQHFWTLSIEEQVFLVLPVLVLVTAALGGAGRAGRHRSPEVRVRHLRRRLLPVLAVLAGASATTLWWTYDPAEAGLTAYYATVTRASEFLIGALAAVALGRPRPFRTPVARRAAGAVGPIALAALLLVWSRTADGDVWLYRGGFPAVAALSTAVLVACLQDGGLARALGARPLRELGRRSYGIYLVHWPVVLWLTADRVGVDGWRLQLLQLTVIGIVAWASFAWLEQPIRQRRRLPGRAAVVATPLAMLATVTVVLLSTLDPPASDLVFDRLEDPVVSQPAPDGEPTDAAPVDARPVTLVVGDSMANNLAVGLARVAADDLLVYDRSTPGCGLTEADRRVEPGGWKPMDPRCAPGWRQRWAEALEAVQPDVVVLQVGAQEVWDRRTGGEEVRFDEPAGRDLAHREVAEAVDLLSSQGATVVVVTLPASDWSTWGLRLADEARSINNPEWVARWNQILADVVATRPQAVLADLAALLTPAGTYQAELDGVVVRAADGLHLTAEGQDLAAGWLTERVLAAHREAASP